MVLYRLKATPYPFSTLQGLHLLSFVSILAFLACTGFAVAAGLGALEPDPGCAAPTRLDEAGRRERRQLLDQQREALKNGKLAQAIEIQRQRVRLQCNSRHQLYYMAELLLRAGDAAEAVEWLERLYDRKINDLEKRLATPANPLHRLQQLPEFLDSKLARKMAGKRREFDQRRRSFLEKLDALTANERPPADYVAKDVCPFECCTYTEWDVLEDTELVAVPQSIQVVGKAVKGTKVEGIRGEVHLRPTPVAVVFSGSGSRPEIDIRAGEIVFLLDHIGEGYRYAWHRGAVYSLRTVGKVQNHCPFPSKDCWGEFLLPENEQDDYAWWVRVRLPDGTEGWTAEVNFGNIDACG